MPIYYVPQYIDSTKGLQTVTHQLRASCAMDPLIESANLFMETAGQVTNLEASVRILQGNIIFRQNALQAQKAEAAAALEASKEQSAASLRAATVDMGGGRQHTSPGFAASCTAGGAAALPGA